VTCHATATLTHSYRLPAPIKLFSYLGPSPTHPSLIHPQPQSGGHKTTCNGVHLQPCPLYILSQHQRYTCWSRTGLTNLILVAYHCPNVQSDTYKNIQTADPDARQCSSPSHRPPSAPTRPSGKQLRRRCDDSPLHPP
jgi:hypothetical protein